MGVALVLGMSLVFGYMSYLKIAIMTLIYLKREHKRKRKKKTSKIRFRNQIDMGLSSSEIVFTNDTN